MVTQNENMTRIIAYITAFVLLLSINACLPDKGKNIPDVSGIELNLNVQRFEKDLMSIDTLNLSAEKEVLLNKYPVFMKEVFLPKILPALQDTNIMAAFIKSPGIQKLKDTCEIVFGDFGETKAELEEAFRFYKYYLPQRPVPKVVTFISEYTVGVFTYDNILGIGLDFFLGKDYPMYDPGYFPRYIRRTMNKDHLVAKAVEAVASDLVGEARGTKLLDLMVNNGKIIYVVNAMLPYLPDSVKLGYSAAQTQWCVNNEQQMWSHLLKEELLYETQLRDIRKLVEHSPNSPGMPPEAPGRTGNWIGWQIVKSYMQRYPETTVEQLIELNDAQEILTKGKYKPR